MGLATLPLLMATETILPMQAQTGAHARTAAAHTSAANAATIAADGSLHFRHGEQERVFLPQVTIRFATQSPGLGRAKDKETAFWVPTWQGPKGKTADFFAAGETIVLNASHAERRGSHVVWSFPKDDRFAVEGEADVAGAADPVVHVRMKALKPGYYSIGYTGAPSTDPAAARWVWQPLVWQEKRFPSRSFLSTEFMCPLPATYVQAGSVTVGLAVDPVEAPFRLPTLTNSRFGVALRNREGKAQPMAFAPVFGADDSHMDAGKSIKLTVRPFVRQGDWFDAYAHVARDLFGFHDYRHNGPVSLNTTLDNMIDFAMNDEYSGWRADLRGFDYTTDVPETVKVVSALHPLSISMLRDDPEIYRRRSLPMIEYLMSRQKYLFAEREGVTGQNASHLMKGPAAEVSELAALYLMSNGESPVFGHYADLESKTPRRLNLEMVSTGDTFQDLLALYRMTGKADYLARAKDKADAYIKARVNTTQTDFSDVHVPDGGQFWTDFAPKWIDLEEMYEETHEKRYLDAAVAGAKEYMEYVWLQPMVPNGNVTVNKGGKTVISYHSKLVPDPKPIDSPEQEVPAWRVSQIGLTPEASTTYGPNPAVMLTHYAAYLLRLSEYTGNTFFRDVARSAVLGRYESFPGYDINGEYTTTYQRADFPLRPWKDLTYNQVYYNHVWPHIALLADFLVSDAVARSHGAVNFPARYAQAYAYLQSKVYGDQAGTIYGEKNVRLWMPKGVVTTTEPEINYVSGYNEGSLYVVMTNQSDKAVRPTVRLDPNVVPFDEAKKYRVRVWKDNQAVAATTMTSGAIDTTVTAKGITVLAIDGIVVHPQMRAAALASPSHVAGPVKDGSFKTAETPLGPVHGMVISMGPGLTSGYVWLEATEKDLRAVTMRYRVDGSDWKTVVDERYPFEFSVPLAAGAKTMTYSLNGTRNDGSKVSAEEVKLER